MNAHVSTHAASGQQTIHFIGSLLTFRARAADTDGAFSLIECRTAPGAGAPPHHQEDAEAFLVMEGSYEFMLNGETRTYGPGEFVYIRPGAVHAFRNPAETPSRMLIVNLPGGLHENFFLHAGEVVEPGTQTFPPMSPPNIPMIIETAGKYGVTILPPPSGQK